jgi:hypothetical protein
MAHLAGVDGMKIQKLAILRYSAAVLLATLLAACAPNVASNGGAAQLIDEGSIEQLQSAMEAGLITSQQMTQRWGRHFGWIYILSDS